MLGGNPTMLGGVAADRRYAFTSGNGMTVSGQQVSKTGNADGAWNSGTTVSNPLIGDGAISAIYGGGGYIAFGLDVSAAAILDQALLDYCWVLDPAGSQVCNNSGTPVASGGAPGALLFTVEHSGANILFKRNGVTIWTIGGAPAATPLYGKCVGYNLGASLTFGTTY